ncbi:MAG: glutamate--tRNA ligase [Actinomycetota bacterium]|nr:glutamate--tRNA ligase [Actinomycetota bacterium]
MTIRVRFAPSPTGYLHVGGARTALYNWLFARHEGGELILRIEDTDRARSTEDAIRAIIDSMTWLGLDCDEGPYRQMDRLDLYAAKATGLVETGRAYLCYCEPEELEARRRAAAAAGGSPRYYRRCRALTPAEEADYIAGGRRPTTRFISRDEGETIVDDLIRGRVVFDNAELDDLIIMRPDGIPTYNFAAVVDDIEMGMTHVIRGEDHLPNTPRQMQIYEALGAEPPAFAHLSMILGADKAPLSKRHGATSIEAFRDVGYLPETMVNFLALLGWAWDDKTTLFSPADLKDRFSLDKVTRSPAVFDTAKLDWMNGHYIRQLTVAELAQRLIPFWRGAGLLPDGEIAAAELRRLEAMAAVCRERLVKLGEIVALTDFFFKDVDYDPAAVDKVLHKEGAAAALEAAAAKLAQIDDWTHDVLDTALRALADELGQKPGKVFQPIRVAISGRTVSPPLFESLEILGKETSVDRIKKARELA